MLWLIWIGLMLAVPVCASVGVWYNLRREQQEILRSPVQQDEVARGANS